MHRAYYMEKDCVDKDYHMAHIERPGHYSWSANTRPLINWKKVFEGFAYIEANSESGISNADYGRAVAKMG